MSRRANLSFLTGLIDGGLKGYHLGRQIQQNQAADAALSAKPEQSQGYTAEDGKRIEALANAKDAEGQPLYTIGTDDAGNYTATPNLAGGGMQGAGILPSQVVQRQTVTDFMGTRHAGELSEREVSGLRARKLIEAGAMSDPLRAAAAGVQLDQAERLRAKEDREEADRQRLAAAVRADRGGMPSSATAGAPAASTFTPGGPLPGAAVGGAAQPGPASQGVQDSALTNYLQTSTPRVVDELLRQGKIDQAKAYQTFIDTEQGRKYAQAWTDGVRRFSFGDTNGALKSFEGLYNSQLARDGQSVRLTPGKEAGAMVVTMFGPKGEELGAQTLKTDDLLSQAAIYMAPHEAVKHFAERNAKREDSAALLERQTTLETQRQDGRAAADDRRDARTDRQIAAADARAQRTIDAADQRLTRTLDAKGNPNAKPLTVTQQRTNLEIDAAREYISGMDPDEIRRRTAKTTNTGRENPDYDPALARQAGLAARRKIGEDDQFDGAQRPPPKSPAELRKEVTARFNTDRTMNKYRLGKDTDKGTEVLDARGKLVGYYR
ncbi:hypothetical protein [Ottowia beijingensis]|uniref:hypothetical protein n=1 Tax=Ottowia beijingensis TaxID=1207057 RepID=UPI00362FB3E7